MANFDLHALLELRSGDGQLYHSEDVAPNMYENCTFEAARETLIAYGYSPPDDEQLRQLVDPGSHGGEPWSVSQRATAMLAPDLPTSIEYPDDVAVALRQYGAQGFVAHIGFWCDSQARVPAVGPVVASHAEVAIAADSSGITFKNVWPHDPYTLTDDLARRLYDGGGILVFKHPIGGADMSAETEAMLKRIHDSWFGIPLVTPPLPTDGRAANVGDLVVGISRVIGVDPADPTAATLTQHVAHAEQEAADLAAQLTAGLTGLTSGLEQLVAAVKAEADLAPALAALAGHVNSVQAGVDELLKHRTGGTLA